MIAPKVAKPTRAEEAFAYRATTERDGGCCVKCGTAGVMSRDHRLNRSQGGRTTTTNLQLLCGTGTTGCHGWFTSHPEEAVREGWGVPMWANPAEYPARRWLPTGFGTLRLSWVLYTDHGTWEQIDEDEAARRREGRT